MAREEEESNREKEGESRENQKRERAREDAQHDLSFDSSWRALFLPKELAATLTTFSGRC